MDRNERQAWGPLIRAGRTAAGMSQEEVAEAAGTTRRTVGSIERGDSIAQRDVLRRILTVLGLTPPPEVDGDVTAFLAMLSPLMQRITPQERQRLMPEIIRLVMDSLARAPQPTLTVVPDDGAEAQEGPPPPLAEAGPPVA